MRAFSFILAVAFVVAAPSIAGSADGGVPGVGTFTYSGPSFASAASPGILAMGRSRSEPGSPSRRCKACSSRQVSRGLLKA